MVWRVEDPACPVPLHPMVTLAGREAGCREEISNLDSAPDPQGEVGVQCSSSIGSKLGLSEWRYPEMGSTE